MKNLIKWFTTPATPKDVPSKEVTAPETHDHNWEVVTKTYAPPTGDVKGLTNLLFECTSCKEFKKLEMIGSDETQLEELVAKVETFGQQLFRYNNNLYVIAKYLPPTQQQIPVR